MYNQLSDLVSDIIFSYVSIKYTHPYAGAVHGIVELKLVSHFMLDAAKENVYIDKVLHRSGSSMILHFEKPFSKCV